MTLIISVLTQENAVQVSDRRLTWICGPRAGELADDDSNKIVIFEQRMAFGYTGLAQIRNTQTDRWLTSVLAKSGCRSLSDACKVIKIAATTEFRRITLPPESKCHCFAGIGWTRSDPSEPFKPIAVEISNAKNEQGDWVSRAYDSFSFRYQIMDKSQGLLWGFTGQTLGENKRQHLNRMLIRVVTNTSGPGPIARLLIEQIRAIAASNKAVGKNLLVVSLPKAAVPTKPGHHIGVVPLSETNS